MTNRRRGHISVMRPRLIYIRLLKAGNIRKVGEQYATGIRSSGSSSYSLWKSNKKKFNLTPLLLDKPDAVDAIKKIVLENLDGISVHKVHEYTH